MSFRTARRTGMAWLLGFWIVACLSALYPPGAKAAGDAGDGFEVMREFIEQEREASDVVTVSERRKHQILFFMGAALLISIITTAWLGISMVLFGKQVFVAHMIFAGISVFLSIVHAVTAIVWFFPF